MTKAIWITGATSGIGKSMAKYFTENGETVLASSRRADELSRLSESFRELPGKIIPVQLDVSDIEQVKSVFENLKDEFNITGLINNAGISSFAEARENSLEEIKKIIDTNLLGAIYLTRTILPSMIEQKSGRIINVLSVAVKKILSRSSIYSASKSGLEAYMNVLREEVREFNIRITNIYPGATKTPIWPNRALEKYSSRMMNPDHIAKVIYDCYKIQENIVTEEIVIRPQGGDL